MTESTGCNAEWLVLLLPVTGGMIASIIAGFFVWHVTQLIAKRQIETARKWQVDFIRCYLERSFREIVRDEDLPSPAPGVPPSNLRFESFAICLRGLRSYATHGTDKLRHYEASILQMTLERQLYEIRGVLPGEPVSFDEEWYKERYEQFRSLQWLELKEAPWDSPPSHR